MKSQSKRARRFATFNSGVGKLKNWPNFIGHQIRTCILYGFRALIEWQEGGAAPAWIGALGTHSLQERASWRPRMCLWSGTCCCWWRGICIHISSRDAWPLKQKQCASGGWLAISKICLCRSLIASYHRSRWRVAWAVCYDHRARLWFVLAL